jgi:hypothetical protein
MGPKAKMIYFPFHGLGEPLRWMMAYTGVEWTEEILTLEEWPEKKPSLFLFNSFYKFFPNLIL